MSPREEPSEESSKKRLGREEGIQIFKKKGEGKPLCSGIGQQVLEYGLPGIIGSGDSG